MRHVIASTSSAYLFNVSSHVIRSHNSNLVFSYNLVQFLPDLSNDSHFLAGVSTWSLGRDIETIVVEAAACANGEGDGINDY